MEDKTFELLTKMYSEFSEFRKETNQRFDKVEYEIKTVGNQVVKLENEHGKKLDALFDGYKQLYEKQQEHDKRFDKIENKLDNLTDRVTNHDTKFEVLEGGKQK